MKEQLGSQQRGGGTKVAIICPRPSVWQAALARLLQTESCLDVLTIHSTDEACLETVRTLQPRWVILVTELDGLRYSPSLAEIFSAAPRCKVILLSHCDNKMRVYSSEELTLSTPAALLNLLSARSSSRATLSPGASTLKIGGSRARR